MNIKKIGWQKYEDYIEKQLSSPILTSIIQNVAKTQGLLDDGDEGNDEEDDEDEEGYDIENSSISTPLMALTSQIIEDVSMLANFYCWMGHTNFDVTPTIKNMLEKAPGIEMLKICSRYRFFIAIGKMFDFADVRKYIEDLLLEGNN